MIRALLGIGLLQFVSMLLLLVRTKVLAIAVGVDGVGTIANVDALAAVIAQTLSLSLPFAALRFLPDALRRAPADSDLLYRQMRLVLLTLIGPASLLCVALALFAPTLFGVALLPYQRTLILGFAGLPVVALVPFLTNAYAGAVGHMHSMRLTVAHSAVLGIAALAAAVGLGVDGFYAVYAFLGTCLVAVAAGRLAVPGITAADRRPLRARDAMRLTPGMWSFALWLLPLTFLAPYAGWFVKYTTLKLYGVASAGILQSAIGLSISVRALLGAAHAVFLTPHVSRESDPVARMEWADEFQRTTGLLFALTLPPLLLFSDIAVRVLYAPAFVAGSAFVALFVAAEVVGMLAGTYQALIIAAGSVRFHLAQNLLAQALLAGTAAVALPRLGLAGAGLAALAAPIFLFVTTLLFLRRAFGVRPSAAAVRSSIVTVVILIVGGTVGSHYPGLSVTLIAEKAMVCLALWIAALASVPAVDRDRLQLAATRLVRGLRANSTPRDEAA